MFLIFCNFSLFFAIALTFPFEFLKVVILHFDFLSYFYIYIFLVVVISSTYETFVDIQLVVHSHFDFISFTFIFPFFSLSETFLIMKPFLIHFNSIWFFSVVVTFPITEEVESSVTSTPPLPSKHSTLRMSFRATNQPDSNVFQVKWVESGNRGKYHIPPTFQ